MANALQVGLFESKASTIVIAIDVTSNHTCHDPELFKCSLNSLALNENPLWKLKPQLISREILLMRFTLEFFTY